MKLRIKGNSLRLRLSRGEVERLAASGLVEDSIRFGPGQHLAYVLTLSQDEGHLHAQFSESRILVRVPETLGRDWASSDRVGMEVEQPLPDGQTLRLLVEKDFACLKPRAGEDDADAFPHPTCGVTC